MQWVAYMRHAGVRAVYLYDHNHREAEKTESLFSKSDSFPGDFVTWINWERAKHGPYPTAQVDAYKDAIFKCPAREKQRGVQAGRGGCENVWHLQVDIDEYPFSPQDQRAGWLPRIMQRIVENNGGGRRQYSSGSRSVGEISMKNFLFLGARIYGRRPLIERATRRTAAPGNNLDKPILRVADASRIGLHHNSLRSGRSVDVDPSLLRFNHYWGKRMSNWDEGCAAKPEWKDCLTPEKLEDKTVVDKGLALVVADRSDHPSLSLAQVVFTTLMVANATNPGLGFPRESSAEAGHPGNADGGQWERLPCDEETETCGTDRQVEAEAGGRTK